MNHDVLREFRDAVPFIPFRIRVADGRTFHVPHRDYLSISPTSRTVIVHKKAGGFHTLNSMLITEIDPDKAVEDIQPAPSVDA